MGGVRGLTCTPGEAVSKIIYRARSSRLAVLVLACTLLVEEAMPSKTHITRRWIMAPRQHVAKLVTTPANCRAYAPLAWVNGQAFDRGMSSRGGTFLSRLPCSYPKPSCYRFSHPGIERPNLLNMRRLSIESPPSADTKNSGDCLEIGARHWFTELLPEGWCVGVCAPHDGKSVYQESREPTMNSTSPIHIEEYKWGQDNFVSDVARTSYYLGRTALRMSLKTLLESEFGDGEDISQINSDGATSDSFYSQLHERIQSTAIMKDYYGRPILPEIIAGSISHKGEYAVGLAEFRSCTWNGSNREFRGLDNELVDMTDASNVQWREECPILVGDETADETNLEGRPSDSPTSGVGIDLERIDPSRGSRIKRKVLTESENNELGRLEDIGVSSEEEVLLRFSLKESVYKAMHPILCQYVGFQEAEITPLSNGTADVRLNLTSGAHEDLGIVVRSASWKKIDGFFLTSASVGVRLQNNE